MRERKRCTSEGENNVVVVGDEDGGSELRRFFRDNKGFTMGNVKIESLERERERQIGD